jgi:hypothetical protein
LVLFETKGVSILDWDCDIAPLFYNNGTHRPKTTTTNSCIPFPEQHAIVPFRHYRPYPMVSPISSLLWSGTTSSRKRSRNPTDHRSVPMTSASSSYAEINHVVLLDNYMYGASGDAFGCYKWDLTTGQIVATYHHHNSYDYYLTKMQHSSPTSLRTTCTNQNNYLHTVEHVPDTNLILTGGEDGILGIWDTCTNQLVDTINVQQIVYPGITNRVDGKVVVNPTSHRRGSHDDNTHVHGDVVGWISCCQARDEQWWIVAGGIHLPFQKNCGGNCGYIATFHGPTRTVLSISHTTGIIHQLTWYYDPTENNHIHRKTSATSGIQHMLAASNTHYVTSCENIFQLNSNSTHRIWCHSPSIYAMAAENACSARIAVGGVGPTLDLLEDGIRYSKQLSTF